MFAAGGPADARRAWSFPERPVSRHKADLFEGGTAFPSSSAFPEGPLPRRLEMIFLPCFGGWSTPRPGSPGSEILAKRQLSNVAEDVAESTNRLQQHPDIAADLERLLRRFVDDGRSTPGKPQANSVVVELDKGGA